MLCDAKGGVQKGKSRRAGRRFRADAESSRKSENQETDASVARLDIELQPRVATEKRGRKRVLRLVCYRWADKLDAGKQTNARKMNDANGTRERTKRTAPQQRACTRSEQCSKAGMR